MLLHTSNTFTSYNYPLKEAEIVFLGIPFSSTGLTKSSYSGPTVIRQALKMIQELPERKYADVGDLSVVPGSYELTSQRIRDTIFEIKSENKDAFLVITGGEHLITLPVCEALAAKTIIHLDAHSDTLSNYLGNKHTHQTWAYHASKFSNIMQVGVNVWAKGENDFVKNSEKVHAFDIDRFLETDFDFVEPVHLTIDMDVIEGMETQYPEGVLTKEDVMNVIDKIKRSCTLSSMDIVEITDDKLGNNTSFTAAQLVKKVLE
ncbi:arginase family protein [Candidatus Aenigmatarchaeota archaeon]